MEREDKVVKKLTKRDRKRSREKEKETEWEGMVSATGSEGGKSKN